MSLLVMGFQAIFKINVLLWIMLGVTLGVVFGAMPGISATMSIVLCISFTYSMDPVIAIAFLAAVYCASITGGSITAIMFKIPGTPSSAATVLDGYPLVQKGEAGRALSVALIGSALGGLLSAIIMFLLTQPLMSLALKFNAAEQFMVCFLGLSLLTFIDSDNKLNTFISGLIGLFLGCVGLDRFSSVPRFTFGNANLLDGVTELPFMLGMFAIAEILTNIHTYVDFSAYSKENQAELTKLASFKELFSLKWTALRSGVLGTFVGIVPGAGATIASWLSYSIESKMTPTPELMGHGDTHGICASETANNAATGGAMVPLLAMGIPGSNAAAMMMTALSIHGVMMGPMLLQAQPEYLSATFTSMIIANILMIFISLLVARVFAQVLRVPYYILGTLIMMLAITGCYAYQARMFDIVIMIIAGAFGYFFKKYKFNSTALILGLVLGSDTEYYLRRGLKMKKYNFLGFFERPIFTVLFAVFVVLILFTVVRPLVFKKKKPAQ